KVGRADYGEKYRHRRRVRIGLIAGGGATMGVGVLLGTILMFTIHNTTVDQYGLPITSFDYWPGLALMGGGLAAGLGLMIAALALGPAAGAEDPLAALEKRQQQIFEQIGPSVVFIAAGDRLGSGFFVDGEGLILTNAHVVGREEVVRIVSADGKRYQGRVIQR